MNTAPDYFLGHADLEIERLQLQAVLIGGITRHLISEAGIQPGMRVLDIGCGAGDVSMLLAEAIGDRGSVVAFDREPRAIEVARARALAAGYRQIEFVVAAHDVLPEQPAFDAAVGRYVLLHQADPVAMIRRAAAAVRRQGVVAFHEPVVGIDTYTPPTVDLAGQSGRRLNAAFHALSPHAEVGSRLVASFEEAGLPTPHLICEPIAGGPDSPVWQWLAMSYRCMRPHMVRFGLTPADAGDPDTLADRLVATATAERAQIVFPPQVRAWAIRP
jgi:2-polyprenyl-3-methyl-5-hydroxy-6-metoxy-1,4-benzoquinol methylase